MGKKRSRPVEEEKRDDAGASDSSVDEFDEEITFKPTTKEERKRQEQLLNYDEEEEEVEEEDEEEEDVDEDMVNVDFGFSDPKPAHFKSVRNFLRFLLMGSAKDVDFSPLVDAVVNQVEAGSIVEVNGEEDAYAFLTVLHLQEYKVVIAW